MKILYVITKSNYGGAQRYVFDLATAFHRDGHEVSVALGGSGTKDAGVGRLGTLLEEQGIRVIHIQNFMRDVSLAKDIGALFELTALTARERPDVLHVTSSKAGGLGAFAGRVSGIKRIVFTSHGLTFDESWRPAWQRMFIKYFTWLTILLSHKSIMISQATARRAQELPFCRNKVVLVHNGLEKQKLLPRSEASKALGLETISEKAMMLGTIAELHPNKNLNVVLEALKELGSLTPPIHFAVIGTGEMESMLKEKAEKYGLGSQVHFLGYVNEAFRYLSAFDIFVLPSFKEGLPYVLLEAGTAKLPVIASNIDGNTDIIAEQKTGLLFDPHSATALTEAIRQLASNPEQCKTLGETLSETVEKEFLVKHMVAKTAAVYEN
jgi:glycosyltransferase involved in cell wall biosynthesis